MVRSFLAIVRSSRLLRPAIFGAYDGLTVILGVLFSLTGHSELIIPAALGVAIAEGVGMAAGEWLSDSDNGFAASLVIGLAVIIGSLAPALPFVWLAGVPALLASAAVLLVLGAAIAVLRADRGVARAFAETYGVLLVTVVAVYLVELLTPGGAK